MNRLQATVLGVAAANIALVLLFPPYDSLSISRAGGQSFDAFYFVFGRHFNKVINTDLLMLALYWVLANAALGWLLLRNYGTSEPVMAPRTALVVLAVVNLVLVVLFPPFENYASTLRFSGTYFDGFYFLFGDKWNRRIYVPLLYMEVLWIVINAALLWLLMREPQEEDDDF
ncbi:MAG: hypothetical protein A2W04_04595 [Betaproteobacteria bacterium RBG_16_64_9]|nr:MAG: hypothetical protein A2W04_04595 [Betaproteobacteria bacterium RBG_16_64_9]